MMDSINPAMMDNMCQIIQDSMFMIILVATSLDITQEMDQVDQEMDPADPMVLVTDLVDQMALVMDLEALTDPMAQVKVQEDLTDQEDPMDPEDQVDQEDLMGQVRWKIINVW